jgi:hypothetical protein
MVIVHHPPYSPDLAPYDISLFPKCKMELKRLRFESVSDIRRKPYAVLQYAVLYSIKENYFHGTFETWKKDGIAAYVPKEVILKKMAAKIE